MNNKLRSALEAWCAEADAPPEHTAALEDWCCQLFAAPYVTLASWLVSDACRACGNVIPELSAATLIGSARAKAADEGDDCFVRILDCCGDELTGQVDSELKFRRQEAGFVGEA